MTLGFMLFTIGTALIYTAFQPNGMTLEDLLRGRKGSKPDSNLSGDSALASVTTPLASGSANPAGKGIVTYDGHSVCAWLVKYLDYARDNGWTGSVTSGYRDPQQQANACIGVCGNPAGCPGTCAPPGTSNHQGSSYPSCAVDVTDYETFGMLMEKIGNPIFNDLPDDPVHFSASGH